MEDKLICAAWGLVMQVRKYRLLPRKHAAIYTKMRPPQPQSHFQCKPYCYSIPLMHHCLPHHPHVLLFWSSPLTAALAEWPDCSLPGEACAGSYQKLFSKDDLFPLLQQIQCSKLLVIRSAVFRPWQRHGPVFLCGLSGLALFRRRSTHWTQGPE